LSYRCATSGGCGLQTSPSSLRLLQRAAEWSPSHWLLALGIPFGLAFAILTPPLQAPDELAHLARALAISEGTLGAEAIVDGRPSIRVPQSLVVLPARLGKDLQMHAERRQDRARIERELARPQELSPRSWRPLPSLYSPIAYLPQAAGVAVARMLGLPVLAFVYAGRLANLAAFLAVTWLALRATPAHATPLLLVALLPMTLFLAASLSADAPTNALAFGWLGLVLRATSPGRPLGPRESLALGLAAAALGLAKPGYALLVAMALAVPRSRFTGRTQQALTLTAWAAAALVPGLLWSVYVASLAPGPLVPEADPGAQLRWMATHPAEFAGVVAASLVAARRLWLASFIGVLGHADTWLPRWLYAVHPLVLLGAGVTDGGGASPLRGGRRVLALAIAGATGLATLAIAYVGWNAVASTQLQGVQGRYFTPFAPLVLAALHAPRAKSLSGTIRLAFLGFAAFALVIAVAHVAARYYG
jgi:uncharacterized membrane protein